MDYRNKWETVRNNVINRLVDNSLLNTLSVNKKIKRQTKIFNDKLKKIRTLRSYKHYLSLRQQVLDECPDSEIETDDEPNMDYESYKQYYNNESHSESARLRTFLQLCVRMKGRSNYKDKTERKKSTKKPTVVCNKLTRVRGVKNYKQFQLKKNTKVNVQTNLTQYLFTSSNKPATLSSKVQNSRTATKKLPSESGKVLSISRDEIKVEDNDCEENNSGKKRTDDSASHIENGSLDICESMFGKRSAIDSDNLAEYNLKETPLNELQSVGITELENPVESDGELLTPISLKQDLCNVVVDATEDLDSSDRASDSGEIFIKPNLRLEDNLRITKETKNLEVEFHLPIQTDVDALTSDHDSGNNSLSDTNSFAEQHERRHSVSADDDNCIEKPVTECDLEAMESEIILPNELESVETGNLDDDSNVLQTKLERKILLKKEMQIGSKDDLIREKSPELIYTHESDAQSERKSPVKNKANKSPSELKIQKIERYKERHDSLNSHWLFKLKNIELFNDSAYEITDGLDKIIEKMPPQPESDGDTLSYRKQSANRPFSLDQSNHSDGSSGNEISSLSSHLNRKNIQESNAGKSSLAKDDKRSKHNSSSGEHNFPTIQSPIQPLCDSNHSSINSFSSFHTRSYDEEFENCGKKQLLSEFEPLSKHDELCKENNFSKESNVCSQNEELSLLIGSNEGQDERIDVQSITERTQWLASTGSIEKSNHTEIQSQYLNEYSDITDSLSSPEPASNKRPISNIATEFNMFPTSIPSSEKQPRLLRQTSNSQLKVISCEYKAPKATSCELQPAENKDDSPNRSDENLSRAIHVKPKKKAKSKRRPHTLEEFSTAEGLYLDMTEPYFRSKNISEDDEIWLMDVPKTIDPRDLKDQTILLGGKSTMIIEDKCYKVSGKRSEETFNISCIFATSKRRKEYDIVNVETQGRIKFTQKHSVISETRIMSAKPGTVPFPKNLRRRHPLLGTVDNSNTERE